MFAPVIGYSTQSNQAEIALFIKGTDDISTLFCSSVLAINTRSANRCIAVMINGFSLKATFVNVHNRVALLCKAIKLTLLSLSRAYFKCSKVFILKVTFFQKKALLRYNYKLFLVRLVHGFGSKLFKKIVIFT